LGDWSYYDPLNKTYLPSITNCLNRLKDIQPFDYQGIIYVGDQDYDIDNSTNYDNFLKMLEPYSSIWPFMATPGNH
jgi:hypothetical protein